MADKKYLAFKDEVDDINDVLTAHGTRYTEVVESSARKIDVPKMSAKRASIDILKGSMRKCTNLVNQSKRSLINQNGISCEYIAAEDCISINGTCTDNFSYTICTMHTPIGVNSKVCLYVQTVSGTMESIEDSRLYVLIKDKINGEGKSEYLIYNFSRSDTPYPYTVGKTTLESCHIVIASGATFNNYKFRIMLNAGDTALPYEKYYKGFICPKITAFKSYDSTGTLISNNEVYESPWSALGYNFDEVNFKQKIAIGHTRLSNLYGTSVPDPSYEQWEMVENCAVLTLPGWELEDGIIQNGTPIPMRVIDGGTKLHVPANPEDSLANYGFTTLEEWRTYLGSRYSTDPVEVIYRLTEPTVSSYGIEADNALDVEPEGSLEVAFTALPEGSPSDNLEVQATITFDMISEGVDKPYLYNYVDRATSSKKYGVLWDMLNSKCVSRLWDAADITLDTTNFGHFGAINPNYDNPFDDIYPWADMKLCNYDVRLMNEIVSEGYDPRDAIIAWEDEPGFTLTPAIATIGVGRYSPEFWYTSYDTDEGRVFGISGTYQEGWLYAEPMIGGRWFGTDELVDGKHILGCRPGIPACNISMQNLHTYAKNAGMTIDDIYSYDAITALFVVEYANTNSQNAIGKGCDSLYSQSGYKIQTSAENTTTIQVLASQASNCIPNAIIDIGTTDGGMQVGKRYIISKTVDETNPDFVNLKLNEAVTVTTDNYWAIHGITNTADAAIGSKSGYIGTNGKCNAYYRGQVFHSNMFRYVLGAYREKGTANIWIAKSRRQAEDLDALNKSAHINTGIVLPNNAAAATSGYIKKIAAVKGKLAMPPFCTEIGGNNLNPVGDYAYVPMLTTANTILRVGGDAYNGTPDGRCYGCWYYAAGYAGWGISALPFSKSKYRR